MALDFEFTLEQKMIEEIVWRWASTWLEPQMEELYEQDRMPPDLFRELGKIGVNGVVFEEKYGGAGLGYVETLLIYETIARVSNALAMTVGASQTLCFDNFRRNATEEQKMEILPKACSGEYIGCLGITEPNAGSDLASLQTRAVEQGDNYVINGQKIWCSYAHYADYCWLGAVTDPDLPKHRNMSMFVVDMKNPGITIRPLINVIGCHSFNEVFFDDVRTPKDSLVGVKNNGWFQLAMALDFERSGVQTAAANKLLLDHMVNYAKTNKRGGKLLSKDPILRNLMAEMAIEIEVARMLCYRIAWIYSKGGHSNYESSQAMIFGSELLRRISDAGMRVLGQYGQLAFGSHRAVERAMMFRSYLASLSIGVGGGTNEIQRNIIAMRGLGLPRK